MIRKLSVSAAALAALGLAAPAMAQTNLYAEVRQKQVGIGLPPRGRRDIFQ